MNSTGVEKSTFKEKHSTDAHHHTWSHVVVPRQLIRHFSVFLELRNSLQTDNEATLQ